MIVYLAANPSVDRLFEVDRLAKGEIHRPASFMYVRGRYPVGSGDAFLAGLVTALDRGDGWEDALRSALGAGAANAEMPGAARLDPDRARALASQAEIHLL
jgi:fructose-1-phosphate kinase PfkB-like protein